MRVTEVVPASGAVFDADGEAGRTELTRRYDTGEAALVRVNMITSLTGAAVGADGTSDTLTSVTDRAILGIIRRLADIVVVGAATVRAEGYLLPRTARLGVVTTSGDLTGHRFTAASRPILLICPADAEERVRERAGLPDAETVPIRGAGPLEPAAIVAALRDRGLARVVCEGGPTLARRFAEAGVVDEYCITVAPALEPAAHPFLPVSTPIPVDVAGMLADEAGFSYRRLRPRR